jgi:tungstate ABC transporter binding protein WtpA
MAVNPVKQPATNIVEANRFINWLISAEGKQFIGDYGKEQYGKGLFTPLGSDICTAAPFSCDCTGQVTATKPVRVFAAGSLSSPFTKLNALLESRNTDVDAQLYTGGSIDMIRKITTQNRNAQVLASADYYLIPQNMIPNNASWYVNFARNRMVLIYTDSSQSANQITANNWYDVLRQDGVSYMISDPNTDPAGYRSLMTIKLAEQAYGNSGIFESLVSSHSNISVRADPPLTTILASSPKPDNRKFFIGATATDVVNAVKNGSVDYAFEYVSVAKQNGLKYVDLPAGVDLSSLALESTYAKVRVETQKGGVTSLNQGSPIIYGVTVPSNAETPELGIEFIKLLLSADGQKILSDDGQEPLSPMLGYGSVPADLRPLVTIV